MPKGMKRVSTPFLRRNYTLLAENASFRGLGVKLRNVLLHDRFELLEIQWLLHNGYAAGFFRLFVVKVAVCGNGDDRYVNELFVLTNNFDSEKAIRDRHPDVHQNEVGLFKNRLVDRFYPVDRLDHIVTITGQQDLHHVPRIL